MTRRQAALFAVAAVIAAVAVVVFAVRAPTGVRPTHGPATSGGPWSPSQTYAQPR